MTTARLLLVDGATAPGQSVLSNGRTDRMDETAKAYLSSGVPPGATGAAIMQTHG